MAENRYLVLLHHSGKALTESQVLDQQMLYFLDDHHLPVQVAYEDRLPSWVRRHALAANLWFALRLLLTPAATILADFELYAKLGPALALARALTQRRVLLLIRDGMAERVLGAPGRIGRWTARLCLQAAHRIILHSESPGVNSLGLSHWQRKLRFLHWPIRPRWGLYGPEVYWTPSAEGEEGSAGGILTRQTRRWKPLELFLDNDRASN